MHIIKFVVDVSEILKSIGALSGNISAARFRLNCIVLVSIVRLFKFLRIDFQTGKRSIIKLVRATFLGMGLQSAQKEKTRKIATLLWLRRIRTSAVYTVPSELR